MARSIGYILYNQSLIKKYGETCPFCGKNLVGWIQFGSQIFDGFLIHDPNQCCHNNSYFKKQFDAEIMPLFKKYVPKLLEIYFNEST